MGTTELGTSQSSQPPPAESPTRTTIRLTARLQAACALIRSQAMEIRMLPEASLEALIASTKKDLPYPLPEGKCTKLERAYLTAYARRHLWTALCSPRELNFPADYPDELQAFTVEIVGDDDPPPDRILHVSKALEQGMAWIKRQALKAALAPADDDDPILTGPHAELEIPKGNWTAAERATLEAHARYCWTAALSYRDNPRPFGAAASDPAAWLRMFTAGLQTGTQRQALHTMPRWWSHILETAKTSGNVLMLPHPAYADTTPRYLRQEEIVRRFGVDEIVADELKFYFEVLELDERAVESYAAQVRRITHPKQFKAEDLEKNPGLHPFTLRMQLRALAGDLLFTCGWPNGLRGRVAEFLSDYLAELKSQPHAYWRVPTHIAELAEHGPAETDRSVPFYDTDLGQADRDQLALEEVEGGTVETAEEYGDALSNLEDPELVVSGSVDDEDEVLLDNEIEEPMTDGQFEAIAYHRIGQGDTEEDELDGDPLYEAIRTAKPQDVAALKKELWTQEQEAPRSRSHFVWTILWNLIKAREAHFRQEHPGLKKALRALDEATTYGTFCHLGETVFKESKAWPSFAKRVFFEDNYGPRRAEWKARRAAEKTTEKTARRAARKGDSAETPTEQSNQEAPVAAAA